MRRKTMATLESPCVRAPAADAAQLMAPSRWTRVRAQWRSASLDREIATGADLTASPLLAARAAQLTTGCTRERVAASLERVAGFAAGQYPPLRTLPRREAISDNREQLMELARILRDDRAAYAPGVALLSLVVGDGAGLAYTDRSGDRLARQLRRARERLAE